MSNKQELDLYFNSMRYTTTLLMDSIEIGTEIVDKMSSKTLDPVSALEAEIRLNEVISGLTKTAESLSDEEAPISVIKFAAEAGVNAVEMIKTGLNLRGDVKTASKMFLIGSKMMNPIFKVMRATIEIAAGNPEAGELIDIAKEEHKKCMVEISEILDTIKI